MSAAVGKRIDRVRQCLPAFLKSKCHVTTGRDTIEPLHGLIHFLSIALVLSCVHKYCPNPVSKPTTYVIREM